MLTFQDKLKESTLRTFGKRMNAMEEDPSVAVLEKNMLDEKKRHEELHKYIKGINNAESKPPSQAAKLHTFVGKCSTTAGNNLMGNGYEEIQAARLDLDRFLSEKVDKVANEVLPGLQGFVDTEIANALTQRKELKDAGTLVDVKSRKLQEAQAKQLPTEQQLEAEVEEAKEAFVECQAQTLNLMEHTDAMREAHLMHQLVQVTELEMKYHDQCYKRLQQIQGTLSKLRDECESVMDEHGGVADAPAPSKSSGFGSRFLGGSNSSSSSSSSGGGGGGSSNSLSGSNNNNGSNSNSNSNRGRGSPGFAMQGGTSSALAGGSGPMSVSQRIATFNQQQQTQQTSGSGGRSGGSNRGKRPQQTQGQDEEAGEEESNSKMWITKPFFVKHKVHVDTNFTWTGKQPWKQFELLQVAGRGAYGAVYRAMHTNSGAVLAIKVLSEAGNTEELQHEIDILKACRSEFIVSYYGCFHNDKDNTLWILMDFCDGGSVRDIIEKFRRQGKVQEKHALKEEYVAALTVSCVKGLAYLHASGVMHRDVKCGNVLINRQGECKLTDFGVSSEIAQNNYRTSIAGTLCFMAPEMLDINYPGYDFKADIWSLGVSLIEMVEGNAPNEDLSSLQDATDRIVYGSVPKLANEGDYSAELVDFLAQCLTQDPKERPSASELCQHPFVTNAEKTQVDVLQQLAVEFLTSSSSSSKASSNA